MTNDVTAPPVGLVDQLLLHVLGLGFRVHWWGWDGFRYDVGNCRDRFQLWDIWSRFRFGDRIRSGFWHVGSRFGAWCRRVVRFRFGIWSWFVGVNGGRFWFGRIWYGFHIGCRFWLKVGDSRDGLEYGIGCIRRRFWFSYHVGAWFRLVHRLGFPVIWLGLCIGHRLGFVCWPGVRFWPVHWRDGLPVVWLGLDVGRWLGIGWSRVIGISFVVVPRFSIGRIEIPVLKSNDLNQRSEICVQGDTLGCV